MTADILRSIGLDRYDINARLKPALLALLPAIAVAAFWLPQTRSLVASSSMGLIAASGLLFLLSQAARLQGRNIEKRLGDKIGRKHSARLLTHGDNTIAAGTKERYHSFLRAHGIHLSTKSEEQSNANEAFERARSAIDWLLEHTRPNAKASMLHDENIAYGFNRNLYGLKPIAITLAIVAIASHATLLALFRPDNQALWIGSSIGIFNLALGLYWIFGVTRRAVEDASLAYAQRLFSQCEAPAKQSAKKSESKSVSEAAGPG